MKKIYSQPSIKIKAITINHLLTDSVSGPSLSSEAASTEYLVGEGEGNADAKESAWGSVWE